MVIGTRYSSLNLLQVLTEQEFLGYNLAYWVSRGKESGRKERCGVVEATEGVRWENIGV